MSATEELLLRAEVIKFVDEESEAEGARIVTQVDHGVLEMKTAIDRLKEQIEDIHRQIEEWVAFSVCPFSLLTL